MIKGFHIDESVREVLSRPPMAVTPVVREYRCTECHTELEVNNKAPESYAPNWQVKPCQTCLDKLEEATKDEKDKDWAETYNNLEDEHEIDKDVWRRDALQYANEISALKAERDTACANLEQAALENENLKAELQDTKLLLKDAQQAHIFAKFRADRLSGDE